jgi:hypothetical protein
MCASPSAPTRRSGIRGWAREHRVVAFFALAFLVSWWAWPFSLAGLSPTAFFPCGPLVAAVVVIGVAVDYLLFGQLDRRIRRRRGLLIET